MKEPSVRQLHDASQQQKDTFEFDTLSFNCALFFRSNKDITPSTFREERQRAASCGEWKGSGSKECRLKQAKWENELDVR